MKARNAMFLFGLKNAVKKRKNYKYDSKCKGYEFSQSRNHIKMHMDLHINTNNTLVNENSAKSRTYNRVISG